MPQPLGVILASLLLIVAFAPFRILLRTQYQLIDTWETLNASPHQTKQMRKQADRHLRWLRRGLPFLKLMGFDWIKKVRP